MGIIQDKANAIAADMAKSNVEHRVAFDVMIVLTIVEVIYYIVATYKQCKQTPEQAAASMRSGGILERFRLRRAVRQHINDTDMESHVGQKMYASVLNIAQNIQDNEVKEMFDEVKVS